MTLVIRNASILLAILAGHARQIEGGYRPRSCRLEGGVTNGIHFETGS